MTALHSSPLDYETPTPNGPRLLVLPSVVQGPRRVSVAG